MLKYVSLSWIYYFILPFIYFGSFVLFQSACKISDQLLDIIVIAAGGKHHGTNEMEMCDERLQEPGLGNSAVTQLGPSIPSDTTQVPDNGWARPIMC